MKKDKTQINFRKIKSMDFDTMVDFIETIINDPDVLSNFVCKKCSRKECSSESCPYGENKIIIRTFLSSYDGGEILC